MENPPHYLVNRVIVHSHARDACADGDQEISLFPKKRNLFYLVTECISIAGIVVHLHKRNGSCKVSLPLHAVGNHEQSQKK